MTSLTGHSAQSTHKVMLIGNSGAGKTSLIGTLANAGYRCFIIDMDNGLDILLDPAIVKPECRPNIFFKTFTDRLKGPQALPEGVPQAAQNAMRTLDKWEEINGDGTKLDMGNPYKWGPRDVVMLDSLTMHGEALKRYIAAINNRLGQNLRQSDWGDAIRLQEDTVAALTSEQVKCNVIVTAHLTFQEGEALSGGVPKGYPSALGAKLPPKIARYFNSVLLVEKTVQGSAIKRSLKTVATPLIDLKTPAPSKVPPDMPPDLAQYFQLLEKS